MIDPPRSDIYDDVYFSAAGGMDETRHVFLQGNDLPARWAGRDRFTVAETGFGTGLNFLTCWNEFDRTAKPGAFLDYVSVEKHPLTPAQIHDYLAPWRSVIGVRTEKLCARYPLRTAGFHRVVFDGRVALTLIFDDVTAALPRVDASVDAWFLDGFTPAKNPDMWTPELYTQMARLSAPGATFSTFTAAGDVRRGLSSAGFDVVKAKGFAHKRDMLTGRYGGARSALPPPGGHPGKVAIVGGGLAGAACARVLRDYGLTSVLHERESGIATQASGNIRGLYNPRLSAFRTPESDFYAAAFALTVRALKEMEPPGYRACGALHLITDEDRRKKLTRAAENWGWGDHMRLLDPLQAGDVAGVPLSHAALYLPDAGYVCPPDFCAVLTGGADVRTDQPVMNLDRIDADAVILCNGAGAMDFVPGLKLHTVRGQVTLAAPTARSANLTTNLCYGGYAAPVSDGFHVVGASFQRWLSHTDVMAADDLDNLAKLSAAVPSMAGMAVVGARASLRCSSHDRFPVIGRVDGRVLVSAAHGSHGIISSLMGAHYLADLLRGGVSCLPRDTTAALSPRRFLRKS
jgi:tRNA 5-methylaminomethyl-2-thiouridine biosynthesis bifunctional protein